MSGAAAAEAATRVTPEGLLALRRHLRPGGIPWHPELRPAGFPVRRRGAGLETIDVRPFVEGDDVRHLDRNVTARTGVPHVRTFHEERGATLLLVADFRADMLWGTRRVLRSVAAAEALALGGWRALEEDGRVGALALAAGETRHVAPRGRLPGLAAVVGLLAEAHAAALAARPAPEPTLDRVLETALAVAPRGATLVLATALDDPGADFDALAGSLGRAGRLKLLLVQDAFELAPPSGAYAYASGSGRHVGWLGGAADGFGGARLAALRRLGVPTMPVDVRAGAEAVARAWDAFER